MCNFYLMYYVEDDEPLDMKFWWVKQVWAYNTKQLNN